MKMENSIRVSVNEINDLGKTTRNFHDQLKSIYDKISSEELFSNMIKSIKEVTGASYVALMCIQKNLTNIREAASNVSSNLQSCVQSSINTTDELTFDILDTINTGEYCVYLIHSGLSYCKTGPEEIDCLNYVQENTLFYFKTMTKETKRLSDDTSSLTVTEEQNVEMCQIKSTESYDDYVKKFIKDVCSCGERICSKPTNTIEDVK